jgi:hypothetical protein
MLFMLDDQASYFEVGHHLQGVDAGGGGSPRRLNERSHLLNERTDRPNRRDRASD